MQQKLLSKSTNSATIITQWKKEEMDRSFLLETERIQWNVSRPNETRVPRSLLKGMISDNRLSLRQRC